MAESEAEEMPGRMRAGAARTAPVSISIGAPPCRRKRELAAPVADPA